MKKTFFIFLLSVGAICQSFLGSGEYMTDFSRTLNDVSQKTVVNIQKEYPFLCFIGIGGALSIEGVIEHKFLSFQTRKEINKHEGIEIISKIIQEFIENAYAEKNLKSYLENHPLTYKNLKITIFVYDKEGRDVYHPALNTVKLSEGIMSYETVSPSERYYLKEESYTKEPYEEAAKRVGVWSPKIP